MLFILLFFQTRNFLLHRRIDGVESRYQPSLSKTQKIIAMIYPMVLLATYSSAQQWTYDIVRGNEHLGTVVASRMITGESLSYHIETHVDVQFIYHIKADLNLQSIYQNGWMISAFITKRVNGDEKTNNRIRRSNDSYCFVNKDHQTSSLQGTITHSISSLYFMEPVNCTHVFSENFLKYVPVKKIGDGKYEVKLPDGHRNTFTYKNGMCTRVEIETILCIVYLIPKNTKSQL